MNPVLFILARFAAVCVPVVWLVGCGAPRPVAQTYANPILAGHDNTSLFFRQGTYYYVDSSQEILWLSACDDPTALGEAKADTACNVQELYGLVHLWHPQIVHLRDRWYIYFSGDNGNTDDHKLYVLENEADDPRLGGFRMRGSLHTDPDNNWAIHAHAFEHEGELYMLWSGWESRRVYVETQCIYIARMSDPWTISQPRVRISAPQYEWERQWVNPDGYKTAYPIYVNEAPSFFDAGRDSLYVLYSASAQWTPYYAVGMLAAKRGSDLLDPASWHKRSEPVFGLDAARGVYGPGFPYVIPSPDESEHYLVYMATDRPDDPYRPFARSVRMQRIGFCPDGAPDFGIPEPEGKPLPKPSGTKTIIR